MIIEDWHTGAEPVVWHSLFGGEAKPGDCLMQNDKALLAVEGVFVVGGALLRDGKLIKIKANLPEIEKALRQEAEKLTNTNAN